MTHGDYFDRPRTEPLTDAHGETLVLACPHRMILPLTVELAKVLV